MATDHPNYHELFTASQDLFRKLVEQAPLAMAVVGLDGTIEFINQRAVYSTDDIPNMDKWWDRAYPDESYRGQVIADWTERVQKALLEGRDIAGNDYKVTCKNGDLKTTFISGVPVSDKILVLFDDITARKLAQDKLSKSEERYRRLVETTNTGYVIIDETGIVRDANQEYVRLTGRETLADILGKNVLDWTAPEQSEFNAKAVADCVAHGYIRNLEITYIDTSGKRTPVEINATTLETEDERTILSLCRDITERKRTENLLSIQHTLAHALNSTNGITAWLELCLDAALGASGMDCGGIYLFCEPDDSFKLCVHKGVSADFVTVASYVGPHSPNAQLFLAGKPVYLEYSRHQLPLDDIRLREGLRAIAMIPVSFEGRVIGCLNLASHTRDDVPLFARTALETIAAQIGTGMARLNNEQALIESEERFSRLAQAGFEAVIIHEQGMILDANQAAAELFGNEYSKLVGTNVLDLTAPSSRDLVRSNFLAGYDRPYEATGLRQDGTTFPGELRGKPIIYHGRMARVTAIRDISERKHAEQSLAAEKERLAVTLRSIGDGVITTDTSGCVDIMNKVAEQLTGWEWGQARGKPLDDVLRLVDEQTRQPRENPVAKVLGTGGIVELDDHTLLVTRNGAERTIANTGAPIKDRDGNTIGVVVVFRDTTEKQKVLDTIQRTAKLDSLGVLAGGIAHDFNNLLTGVFGYVDLARSTSSDAETIEYLDATIAAMNRARALTLQLLTFAKGGAPIQKVTLVVPFVQEAVQFALSGSNVACRFHVGENLWACNIDKNQIGQVIDNIVINAQQAMPNGGSIEVTAQNVSLEERENPELAKGNYVRLSIRDCGIGIPRDIMPRIFDPFYTTKTKGHGLGLATCYSIINRHGGCIDVESEPGCGSVFHIFLPAATRPTVASQIGLKKRNGSGTIVVVDDEEMIRSAIRKMLDSIGYAAVCMSDGREAIDYYVCETTAGRSLAAIILDLTIPGGTGGVEAAAEIRKLDANIPIIVVSGYADDSVMRSPGDYGITASLCKPFTIAELSDILGGQLPAASDNHPT